MEKSSDWSTALLACIPSSTTISTANSKLKRPKTNEATSDEEDETDDYRLEENEIFAKLTDNIDKLLSHARNENAWSNKLGSVASVMFTSSTWIKSMSSGSKIAYEKLTSTKFEDVTRTAEEIFTVMGKAHWAAAGLLVVAAVINNINNVKRVDTECMELLASINTVGKSLARFTHLPLIPEEMKSTVNESRNVIATGAACCLSIINSSRFRKFFFSPEHAEQIALCKKRLQNVQNDLSFQLIFAVYAERHEHGRITKPKPTITTTGVKSQRESPPPSPKSDQPGGHDISSFGHGTILLYLLSRTSQSIEG